jgi:hypothetical protein
MSIFELLFTAELRVRTRILIEIGTFRMRLDKAKQRQFVSGSGTLLLG